MDTLDRPAWLQDRDFTPLPSDPARLTLEQVKAAFAGDWSALKEVVKAAQDVVRAQQTEVSNAV